MLFLMLAALAQSATADLPDLNNICMECSWDDINIGQQMNGPFKALYVREPRDVEGCFDAEVDFDLTSHSLTYNVAESGTERPCTVFNYTRKRDGCYSDDNYERFQRLFTAADCPEIVMIIDCEAPTDEAFGIFVYLKGRPACTEDAILELQSHGVNVTEAQIDNCYQDS